ncbi:FxSxx-COOH system tetratricopeptide repeat protein, partial [Nonomuraea sp. NPDC003709]|uniref:FxSxx-COOH system tetratricopeptide repeat protein n=1 Tax=Nonomuraea sp. NPDC003709 TaxID=3154450 RepID=UPI0033ABE56B
MSVPPPGAGDPGHEQQPLRMQATAFGHGRINQAGRDQINYETVLPVEAVRPVTEVVAPPRLVNVPRLSRAFVGRGDELARLEAALRGGGEVVVAAVHGLGGVGKSTLAARYAHAQARRRDGGEVNPVWWITAESAQAVETGLAKLAVALQPELASALPLEVLAERATAWLATHEGWLLVLDNVADAVDVAPLLERTLAGQVLVTSRLGEGWHRLDAEVLRLDVLGERQALELLARIAAPDLSPDAVRAGLNGDLPEVLDGAIELVHELGCLPLAVEQAGAYLHQTRLTPCAYRELLRAQPAVMYDRAARGADAERTIARIWRLTLDQLADAPLAGQLLRLLAWYGAEPIPRTMLASLETAIPDVQHALGELGAYNMITLDGETITVHRLVQAVARTPDPHDPHRQATDIDTARERATTLLSDALPELPRDPAGWPLWRALLPHLTALTDHSPADTDTTTTAHLLNEAGIFLDYQGTTSRGIACFERSRTAYERLLGADHPHTLASRSNLAGAYESAGDLGRAIPLYEATLADRERLLGADHPSTLVSRSDLANAYRAAGDLARAVLFYESTVADFERVLGTDNPHTLAFRNNLAVAYQAVGDLGRAIPLLEATLAARERLEGADHPDTLTPRNNLAHAYELAGDLGQAIPLYEQSLADCERVLGADHPHTLVSRGNLAGALRAAGDLGRAIPLLDATLADCERVLGADHPHTLTSRGKLASAYQMAGDLGRAIPLLEATLAARERLQGADHPDTLGSRNNLAHAYHAAGDLDRAILLDEATLAACERVLGADHPHTLTSRNNLAGAYESAGDLGRAIPLYEATLADRERVLGADHP